MDMNQVDMPNGHWIKYNVFKPVIDSSRKYQRRRFPRMIHFNCIKMPTSWTIWVNFTRSEDDSLWCETVIKRTDDGPGLVNVQFWTTVHINPVCVEVAYVQHFITRMRSGQADKDSKIVIEPDRAQRLYDRYLLVEFFLVVYGCHSAQDNTEICAGRDETEATDDNKM